MSAFERVEPDALLDDEGNRWSVVDEKPDPWRFIVERGDETQEVTRWDVADDATDWRVAPSAGGGR